MAFLCSYKISVFDEVYSPVCWKSISDFVYQLFIFIRHCELKSQIIYLIKQIN